MTKFLKSKLGFTLVELIIVIVILGILVAIGVPIYSAQNKKAELKVCKTVQKEIHTNVKNYCIEFPEDEEYTFKIKSNSDEEKGILLNADGSEITDEEEIKHLKNDFFKGEVPYCPSDGTYTITVKSSVGGIPEIKVTCNGDENKHK